MSVTSVQSWHRNFLKKSHLRGSWSFISNHNRHFFILPLFILLCRCGQTPTSTPTLTEGTFTHVYEKTLKSACIECHVPTGAAFKTDGVLLDFTSQAKAYSTLTTSSVTGGSSKTTCGSAKIVKATKVEDSYLAAVLFTEYNISNFAGISGCTPYTLHLTDQNISSTEKNSITTWIKNGAK